ncbi:basal body-orientation factor 1-like [Poecilia reticulata]|uniref:basal body-orientation factor 1-like n=1 Tax=Poecilia reticulata TaxID=8081 RepID=UPI0004A4F51B|nr:PREDICTED: basal body-orientation factor 1-like [Poecilia reticulata]
METKRASQGKDKNPPKKNHETQIDEVSSLREMKLKKTEKDLAYHQKEHYKLASEIGELRNLLYKAEINEFGATSYWQKDLKVKGEKIKSLEEQIRNLQELAIEDRRKWENEKKQNFKQFEEDILKRKAIEIRTKKKVTNMRKQMQVSKEEYRENLRKKDEKYMRLERETAERERNHIRHREEMNMVMLDLKNTIVNLENELNDVHRKNNWLIKNLTCTLANLEDTRQLAQSMSKDKLSLAVDKKILKTTLKNNGSDIARLQKILTEVRAKAAHLEQAFKNLEKESTENKKRNQLMSQVELDKLQKIITMQKKEICQVKKLARTIVEKRKDMEVFFYEALDNVRQEIAKERKKKVKEPYQDYRQKFTDGVAGRIKLPPIHTFHQCPKSTQSVYSDMKAAEKLPHLPSKEVYISDLTWEQKERVLTLLFAKMNGDEEHAIYQKMDL